MPAWVSLLCKLMVNSKMFNFIVFTIHTQSKFLQVYQLEHIHLFHRYRSVFQWEDGTIAFHLGFLEDIHKRGRLDRSNRYCGYLKPWTSHISITSCLIPLRTIERHYALCQQPKALLSNQSVRFPLLSHHQWNSWTYMSCPLGHVTFTFLACDAKSACWLQSGSHCTAPLERHPPSFLCDNEMEQVPYTLVCDSRPDCSDLSDEAFCHYPPCPWGHSPCGNGQCIPINKFCDNWRDCYNGDDELRCPNKHYDFKFILPPAKVFLAEKEGWFSFGPLEKTDGALCGETHFQCPKDGYCLPVFLRCNGVPDCPFHEDEADCQNFACSGFYRCRTSAVCLHPREVCDGRAHCPQHDDELLCGWDCPRGCLCYGWSFLCTQAVPLSGYSQLRYLDAHGSSLAFNSITNNPFLVFLNLSHCNFTRISDADYNHNNLLIFDLSYNHLISMPDVIFNRIPRLRVLLLGGNPLDRIFEGISQMHLALRELDLSNVPLSLFNSSRVSDMFPNLHDLNLSYSSLTHILDEGFQPLQELRRVDLRGCSIQHISYTVFQNLGRLQTVYADSFKMCCPQILPKDFNIHRCQAPMDELSSCEDMLGSAMYTVSVFIYCSMALTGNAASFFFRSFFRKVVTKKSFSILVIHLSLSDLVMGIFLAIIGCADRLYHGSYLWNDHNWRHSSVCQLAGLMSFLSMEVSTLLMCLITLDRFLVLRFPFSRLHFGVRSAHAAAVLVWMAGMLLAGAPLMMSHWNFYSQTALCIPLFINKLDFPGRHYSFSIITVLNFVLFLFVSMGQAVIYWSVQKNAMSVNSSSKKTKDLTIARRLISVAMSNFLCWFPIGLLGLLTSRGLPVPREVSVGVAVLVLPLNSALNPFLYTLNVILERRQRAVEDRLKKLITAKLLVQGLSKSHCAIVS